MLHPVAPHHLDVVETLETGEELGVDHRLHETIALGPPELGVRWRHLGEQPAFGVEESQNLIGHCMRQDAVDQADRLEGAQRLVVEADTAGVVDEGVALLDH